MKQVRGIWLPESDVHLTREIELEKNILVDGKGTYQINKYRAGLERCERRRHAVDIGANVGLWSRIMVMDFAKVTAIEPITAHRECFAMNVEGATMLSVAVSSKNGSAFIKVPGHHTASAHFADEGEAVDVVTLDSIDLGIVDFIKIDIEGMEYDAIVGGERTIRTNRPVMVVEQKPNNAERYGRGQWDAVGVLKDWGMKEAVVIGGDHVMVWE